MKRMTLQQMIDARHEISEKLRKAMASGEDMDMRKYADLNDKYHWLNEKIIKKGKK